MPEIDYSRIYIVFLNGPPGSGKDSGATEVQTRLQNRENTWCFQAKFAEPLKRSVFVDAGLPYGTPLDLFESEKEVPKALWGGVSFRDRCIIKSEEYFKPQFGEEIFGHLFLANLEKGILLQDGFPGALIILVTDSGFAAEAAPILRRIPHQNALHARIHAEQRGKTFKGDSRTYIALPETVRVIDVENNDPTPEGFQRYAGELEKWILGTFDL